MSLVDLSVDNAVGLLTLNRPPINALNSQLIQDIGVALSSVSDPSIRAVVVAGAPDFSVGADIKQFAEAFGPAAAEPQNGELAEVVRRLEKLEKPTIAAISGMALGGGFELAMGCDFRYVDERSRVGQPEVLLGLLPGAGGTARLQHLVGYQRAKELVMSGRHVTAEEALRLGLADRVVSDESVLAAALQDAATWAAGPTRAYAAIKQTFTESQGLDDALALENDAFSALFATADARAGVTAFIAKQEPDFEGR